MLFSPAIIFMAGENKWSINEFAKSKGYEVLVIWEKDLKENRERVIQEIKDYARNEDKVNQKDSTENPV
jgi:very-short-patch-repair endonuclease